MSGENQSSVHSAGEEDGLSKTKAELDNLSGDKQISEDTLLSSIDKDANDQREGFMGFSFTAGVIVLFLFIRVLAVSDWNWDTAADIADSFNFDDAISIAFGTLFERPHLTGALISIVLPLALFRLYWIWKFKDKANTFADWFIVVTLAITMFVIVRSFQIWWPVYLTAVVTVALLIAAVFLAHGKGRRFFSRLGMHVGLILVAGFLIVSITINTPWMPREKIVTDQGTIYGYVLSQPSGFLKVMKDDRQVVILSDSHVKSREVDDTDGE